MRDRTVKLQFLGAARQVTGSQYYLEADGARLLVDCGMYQERAYLARNWDPSPVRLRDVHAMLLTHAHVDHCGLAPKLVREGFRGPIITTSASADLVELVLRDAAEIQAEDAAFKEKRHRKEGRRGASPVKPLYTLKDVERTLPLLEAVPYDRPVQDQRPRPGRVSRRRPHPRLGDDRAAREPITASRGGSFSPATWASGTGRSSATRPSSPRPTTS